MAQIKITADHKRRPVLNEFANMIKSDIEINIKEFYLWRIIFMLSLKNFNDSINLDKYKEENHQGISQNFETLIDDDTKYFFINLLCIVHNRKIDINREFPELFKLHCRHGFDILEKEIKNFDINSNITDFLLSQIIKPEINNNLVFQNQKDISENIIKALKELNVPLKFLETRNFDRVKKLFFELEDLHFATKDKLYSQNLILQLETATALRDKIYIQQTQKENVISINILKDNPPIYISDFIADMINSDLSFLVGVDDEDNIKKSDLKELVHILVAGTTGSGKTNFLHTLIYQFLKKDIELYLIDGKNGFEFGKYSNQANVVSNNDDIVPIIKKIIEEMDNRYNRGFMDNYKPIVIIIDEFVDIIMQKKMVEDLFVRISQKGRAAKVHLILATQRPDSSILKGTLRSNLPTRVAFKVQKSTESKIILDQVGAEKLFGKGDMIYYDGKEIQRLQAFAV